ncbi:hypothetical protein ES332_A02G080300v1 [Gossypium tomentosum]|uniref:Uncharacterized protein n=1 Tax=Gossypium tomentosum TaxID=34277 RepID=A0A5D2REE8_GOSTO|nr:hypothetical protein ES332_A02G080300v1 [Gossypium tomentosum]
MIQLAEVDALEPSSNKAPRKPHRLHHYSSLIFNSSYHFPQKISLKNTTPPNSSNPFPKLSFSNPDGSFPHGNRPTSISDHRFLHTRGNDIQQISCLSLLESLSFGVSL